MTRVPVTEAEVRAILAAPMRIRETVQWRRKSNQAWAEATLRVLHPRNDIDLTVKLTVNLLAPEKFTLSVLLNNAQRIYAIDVGGSHENRHTDQNRWVHETHEHRWTDACHGSWACSAGPFPADLRSAFAKFCDRLGIKFTGRWSDPPLTP
jgi:hypothetical protein